MPDINRVQQYFSRSAISFDSLYSQDEATPVIRFLNHRFRRDIYQRFMLSLDHVRTFNLQSVLDVGCGSGRYTQALAQLGVGRILGIDVSASMIDLAKQRNAVCQNNAVEFLCTDFMKFHTSEKFDVVLAMGVFDYVKDPLTFLAKMRCVCNHSVIASFPSVSWYRTPIRRARYYFKRCPVYFYECSAIDLLSRTAGFSSHTIHKIEGAGQDYFGAFFSV